jgi:hypothetical protein
MDIPSQISVENELRRIKLTILIKIMMMIQQVMFLKCALSDFRIMCMQHRPLIHTGSHNQTKAKKMHQIARNCSNLLLCLDILRDV